MANLIIDGIISEDGMTGNSLNVTTQILSANMTATGTVKAPTLSGGTSVLGVNMTATGTVKAPTLSGGTLVRSVNMTGTNTIKAPTLSGGTSVLGANFTATGTIKAPTLSGGTLYGNGAFLTGVGASTFSGGTVQSFTKFVNGLSGSTYDGDGSGLDNIIINAYYKSVRTIQATNATFSVPGIATSSVGTLTNGIDADNVWTDCTTQNAAGNSAGLASTTFSEFRTVFNPEIVAYIKTSAAITNSRFWIGFFTTAPTNTDDLAGSCIAFRYSTVAGDAGWRPVNDNGTTQTLGTAIGTVAINTVYKLKIRIDSATNLAYYSVNGGTETSLGTLPANTTNLGFGAYVINTATGARTIKISRIQIIHN